MGCLAADAFVIHTDVGGIRISCYIAVENYYRHTLVVHLFNYRGKGLSFVGRDYDDVKSVVGKIAYVVNLLAAVIIGRAYLYLDVFVQHGLTVDLVVHFGAPVILTALRHTDFVDFLMGAADKHYRAENY